MEMEHAITMAKTARWMPCRPNGRGAAAAVEVATFGVGESGAGPIGVQQRELEKDKRTRCNHGWRDLTPDFVFGKDNMVVDSSAIKTFVFLRAGPSRPIHDFRFVCNKQPPCLHCVHSRHSKAKQSSQEEKEQSSTIQWLT